MKYVMVALAILFFVACKDNSYSPPENALDAGREFIDNALKGRFNTAKQYMLQDEENNYWLSKWSEEFNKSSEHDKTGYSNASINIMEVDDVVPDSVTVITFSNSYKKIPQHLKVVKYNNKWQVDFKYTFSGNL